MLAPEAVQPVRRARERVEEGRRIGVAELMQLVPVGAARGQRQRGARGRADEATLRVEGIEQRVEVVLVGAPAVEQDERAFGLTRRRAQDRVETHA